MKTSMNLYFNNEIDTKTKLDTIKALGFDEFFTGIYDKNETMTFEEQIQYANQIGLHCTMVHCSYYEPELNQFWLAGEIGENIVRDYINQIQRCGDITKNFVVHLNGSKASTVSEIGIERLWRILRACEKFNLNLCIENVFSTEEIPYVFARINHPLLKICYDCGHKNFLTPAFKVCEEFGKHIAVLHLHENDGSDDQHKMITVNSPIFNQLCHELQYVSSGVVLTSELKHVRGNWQSYLKMALNQILILGQSINRQ